MYKNLSLLLLICIHLNTNAQVVLKADGITDTYDLINSVLAPGYTAVEVPDCDHEAFGHHITQTYNSELENYVFQFHIHRDEDSDRCINYDRQRTEIKSYDQSPDNLKATEGETVEYKWKFKLDEDFQPSSSFTHLHQLKAVGGTEESTPLITLTARMGVPDKLELRYAEYSSQETITKVDLDPFKGIWVEVTETVNYGESGSYSIIIKSYTEQETLLNYSTSDIRVWKTDADFIRPKWGIYRSLNDSVNLRDEIVYFTDFSIEEIVETTISSTVEERNYLIYPNPSHNTFVITNTNGENIAIRNISGQMIWSKDNVLEDQLTINDLKTGVYIVTIYNQQKSSSYKVIVN